MASKPGAYTREGMILGNPDKVANAFTPSGSYPGTPQLELEVGPKYRLLSVVSDVEIDVIQVTANQTPATADGEATRIPAPTSGKTSYACLIHPSTVGVYVKTA